MLLLITGTITLIWIGRGEREGKKNLLCSERGPSAFFLSIEKKRSYCRVLPKKEKYLTIYN